MVECPETYWYSSISRFLTSGLGVSQAPASGYTILHTYSYTHKIHTPKIHLESQTNRYIHITSLFLNTHTYKQPDRIPKFTYVKLQIGKDSKFLTQ